MGLLRIFPEGSSSLLNSEGDGLFPAVVCLFYIGAWNCMAPSSDYRKLTRYAASVLRFDGAQTPRHKDFLTRETIINSKRSC